MDRDDEEAVANNVYNYYPARPNELAHLTLYEFHTQYKVKSTEPAHNLLPAFYVGTSDTPLFLQLRTLPAIPRIYPRMTPESHEEEFYYSNLLLHHPWREEPEDLKVAGCEFYQAAFNHRYTELQERIGDNEMGNRLEAEVSRICLLEEAQDELLAFRRAQGQTEDTEEDLEDDAQQQWNDADAFDPGLNLQQDPAAYVARLAARVDLGDASELNREDEAELAAGIQYAGLGFQNSGGAGMTDAEYSRNKQLMSEDQKRAFFAVVEHVQLTR